MGRPCWICGRPDSTREHVWPDWMKQIASGPVGNYQVGIGDDPTEWREWTGAAFELTSRVLCGPCNGRLGQLEGQVSPLIRSMVGGIERRLYGDEQAVLAQWLYKTGLMVSTTNRRDETTLPRSHYSDLAASFDLPPASMVWIGRVMTPLHDAALWVQRFVWHDSLRVNAPQADGYSLVLTVKDLLGLVAVLDTRQSPGSENNPPPFHLGALGVGRLLRIWPTSEHYGVAWPPGETFSAAEARMLAKTFERAAAQRHT